MAVDLQDTGAVNPTLSNDDFVSRILGFTRFCADQASDRLEQAARARGWLDADGGPTEDGRDLVRALMRSDAAYGVYRLVN